MRRCVTGLAMLAAGMLGAGSAGAQTPGTSTSWATGSGCDPTPSTVVTQTGPVTNVWCGGSASANNATRTVSATALGGLGFIHADASSTQYGAVSIFGTPDASDEIVLHFLTTSTIWGVGGWTVGSAPGGYFIPAGDWRFTVSTGAGGASAGQATTRYDTSAPLVVTGFTQTAGGFDLAVPFIAPGSVFDYTLVAAATVQGGDGYAGGAITATLAGIDDFASNGWYRTSAVFDPGTGLGTLDATVTATPEPSSLALLATGFVGFIPVVRERRRRLR